MSPELIVIIVVLLFGFVVAFGAPYLPTLKGQVTTALDLLNLKPGQTMLELGCGDGRVARQAAKRGIRVVGYELNPLLVLIAKAYNFRYRKLVKIRWADYWRVKWPPADGIYVFLLEKYMPKLDKKIIQSTKNSNGKSIKLVSHGFRIPHKKPVKFVNGVHLYRY